MYSPARSGEAIDHGEMDGVSDAMKPPLQDALSETR